MVSKLTLELERVLEIRALLGTDDPELLHDAVEGETDLFELMDWLLAKETDEIALQEGVAARIAALEARGTSSHNRQQRIRDALRVCMVASGQRSLRRAEATISLKAVPPGISSVDETVLPVDYFVTKRSVSRGAIKDAIESGKDVPGVIMSNGGETLQVRR